MNQVTVTPITPLVNLDQLVGAVVLAAPFDDPVFKYETHIGVIDEVKLNKSGTFVRFKADALTGRKWLRLAQVVGFVHVPESQTTAA